MIIMEIIHARFINGKITQITSNALMSNLRITPKII
jgi:hypothetical protein